MACLVVLSGNEWEWDSYKTRRCSGRLASGHHHQCSRLANDKPSFAVIVAAEPANAPGSLLLGLCLGRLPRQLVSFLQQIDNSSTAIAGVTPKCDARNQILRHYNRVDRDGTASRVCSVDARAPAGRAGGSRASCCCCMLASSPPTRPLADLRPPPPSVPSIHRPRVCGEEKKKKKRKKWAPHTLFLLAYMWACMFLFLFLLTTIPR